jgi:ankyrin repeat protein
LKKIIPENTLINDIIIQIKMDHLNEALCHIVQTPHHNVTSQLLILGADLNYHDKDNCSPIMHAIESGSSQINELLAMQPDITKINWEHLDFVSCFDKNPQLMNNILNNEVIRKKYGPKYLYKAYTKKKYDIVKFLLNAKVDPNILYGKTNALYWAIDEQDLDLIKILLKHNNININYVNEYGYTILIKLATGNIRDESIIDLLLSHNKIDINTINHSNDTALIWAAYHENNYLVEKLIAMGADHTMKDNNGKTAADYYPKITELLKARESQTNENLFDSEGKQYPKLIEDKPLLILKTICYKTQTRTKIIIPKNTKNIKYYVWNLEEKKWCNNGDFEFSTDMEMEIADGKNHYHLHPTINDCYIRLDNVPIDGTIKTLDDLYV